jgi:hypothetical protein
MPDSDADNGAVLVSGNTEQNSEQLTGDGVSHCLVWTYSLQATGAWRD